MTNSCPKKETMDDYSSITVMVKFVTGAAALLEVEGDTQWVPLRLLEDDLSDGDIGETMDVGIKRWKLEELGWG